MPGAIALKLIGEAAGEDELLRSTLSHANKVAKRASMVARVGGADNVDYISLQPMCRNPEDPTEEMPTYPDDPNIAFWCVSLVPAIEGVVWEDEDFPDFASAEARAKELSKQLGGKAIYTE